jgi:endonuclease YncB( thermonuclease family)
VAISSSTPTQDFVALWHRVPWNAAFWLLSLGLFALSAYFVVSVEMRRRASHVPEQAAKIKNGETVRVVRIVKGDEIAVEKGLATARVRMLGIHSFDPVVNEFEITAFGRAAVGFLEQWTLNRPVRLHFDDPIQDVRGRYLAYIERDGLDLNRRMIEEGVTAVYTEYAFAREATYLTSEEMARSARRGVWGSKRAVQRIRALRKQWGAARLARTGQVPVDDLESQK